MGRVDGRNIGRFIEEEIAKLPVKAVLPLILTFAGLIVCFLTVPFVQVGAIASKVSHVAR